MKAPDFRLPDQDGVMRSLDEYKGKWVVVYFYPKDNTPGCTKEACSFRDGIEAFNEVNAVIIGISKDSIASHKKFAEKFHLSFPILSDESKEVIQAYHAWGKKTFMGKTFEGIIRTTTLINPKGEIQKVYEHVNPLVHATQVLTDISSFSNQ